MTRGFILFVLLSTFLFASQQQVLEDSFQRTLYEKNRWKALLHYNNELNIKDNNFILSSSFSLKNELIATINGFYKASSEYKNINNHPQCKFPARLLFISNELAISENEFPEVNCPGLKVYKEKAPADNISLIYVSEKVNNPSSMMGHTFLKYSGSNYQSRHVEHAITFYTVIESVNPLTLLYQNIFSGMKGMFALQPYKKTVEQYTKKENRNVWEYKLNLSNYQKKLIYYHIWELKEIRMKYYFTSYNCSTIIYYNLSLANPKIYDNAKIWTTPLDTVKYLYKYNLIEASNLLASNKWLIKMIEGEIPKQDVQKVKNIVLDNQTKDKTESLNFYQLQLLSAYAGLEYNNHKLKYSELKKINNEIDEKLSEDKKIVDISKYKTPMKIPDERQLGIGYSKINNTDYIELSFLGASHLLNDDNREYFGESELKIGYISLLTNKSKIELKEFTLYGMKSYIPYDVLTQELSYQFELAVKKEYTHTMRYKDTFKIDGGIGSSYQLTKDMSIYALINAGIGYNDDDKLHIFTNPEVGTIIYDVFNMKSIISYQPLFIGKNIIYNKYSLKHNIFLNKNWTFSLNGDLIHGEKDYTNYSILLKKLF